MLSQISAEFATHLVPVIPLRPIWPKDIDENRALLEIRLLRRRQLRRADVQEKLRQLAERRGVAR